MLPKGRGRIPPHPQGVGFPAPKSYEIRIANSALSSNWITTEINNQSSPSTFWLVGNPGNFSTTNQTDLFVLF